MAPLFIITALLLPTAVANPARTYFPPQTAIHRCQYGDKSQDVPLVDEGVLGSFAQALAIAKEPPLLHAGKDGARVVRFTWLRTFHAPIIIRMTRLERGKGWIDTVVLSGHGGYDLGNIKTRRRIAVTHAQADPILALANPAGLVPAIPGCVPPGMDGARWLIERRDASGYHFAERWSPRNGPVRDTGMALLRLAGLDGEDIY